MMKLGIAYDTIDMYEFENEDNLYFDFADISAIHILKQEMESLGFEVELLGNTQQINDQIKNGNFDCDIVYNTVEGIKSRNREGLLPSLFEINHIPYIGTDAFGLSLTLDKSLTKVLARHLGILTPNFYTAYPNISKQTLVDELSVLSLPLILKPNFEGNSSGIVVCKTLDDACMQAYEILNKYNSPILCEEFIFGKEITVPFIGNDLENILFGITSIDIQNNDSFWLDVDVKTFGDYKNILLDLPEKQIKKFHDICSSLFASIKCRDFARFDFRLTENNDIYFIEVNPLPALFCGGSFDVVGKKYGLSFREVIRKIINEACERQSIPKI